MSKCSNCSVVSAVIFSVFIFKTAARFGGCSFRLFKNPSICSFLSPVHKFPHRPFYCKQFRKFHGLSHGGLPLAGNQHPERYRIPGCARSSHSYTHFSPIVHALIAGHILQDHRQLLSHLCKMPRHRKMYRIHKDSVKFRCHTLHTWISVNHIIFHVFHQPYIIFFSSRRCRSVSLQSSGFIINQLATVTCASFAFFLYLFPDCRSDHLLLYNKYLFFP